MICCVFYKRIFTKLKVTYIYNFRRLFDTNLRTLALGVQWIFLRLLGTIPGPVIFGYLFDISCRIKLPKCHDSEHSQCGLYSNKLLATNLFYVPVMFKVSLVV